MYCTRCGGQMEGAARFCSQCGTPSAASAPPPPSETGYKPLVRARNGRWVAGVCAGLGRYWGLDPALVRILFLALAICPVLPAIIPYIVCWIVLPQEPQPQTALQPAAT